ncbi:MAG: OmpA family protein [Acidimicrobiia bacterium]
MPRQKKHEEEEHENHEAWVIPYADMLTLLMVMFLALYAMGNLDLAKFKKLANAFNQEINGTKVVDPGVLSTSPSGGSSVLDGAGSWPVAKIVGDLTNRGDRVDGARALSKVQAYQEAVEAEQAQFELMESTLQAKADQAGFGDSVQFETDARGLHITLLTDQVLFGSGSANIEQAGASLIDQVESLLAGTDNQVEIVGHTDSVPTGNPNFTNWELSTARAGSVVRYLIAHGIDSSRLRASGMADQKPIASNDTEEGRAKNRRVEITILSGVDPNEALTKENASSTATAADGASNSSTATEAQAPAAAASDKIIASAQGGGSHG